MRDIGMFEENFRPQAIYPTYPPYHEGPYLEEYFYKRFNEENIKTERQHIDIFWTNIYCNSQYGYTEKLDIQSELDNLDSNGKYFTIGQHDDFPKEILPPDTLIFAAGGNVPHENLIPIPLICSKLPSEKYSAHNNKFLASFVGSATHPIRTKMYSVIKNYDDYGIALFNWMNTVAPQNLELFISVSKSSKFVLAPRGYGRNSFRLYEAFQLNSVPVYISDNHYLPWTDELNWNDFCVLITEDDLPDLNKILKSIDDKKYKNMLNTGKEVYEKYFTLEGMYQNIIKRLV